MTRVINKYAWLPVKDTFDGRLIFMEKYMAIQYNKNGKWITVNKIKKLKERDKI